MEHYQFSMCSHRIAITPPLLGMAPSGASNSFYPLILLLLLYPTMSEELHDEALNLLDDFCG